MVALVKFNSEKCKIMHLGKNNPKYEYSIIENGIKTKLTETTCEKDLEVMIDPNLDFQEHMTGAVKKASRISNMLTRHISFKNKNIMLPLYTALVLPLIEYGNTVWSPFLSKDILRIEHFQQSFTNQISGMRKLDYYDYEA